MKIKHDPRSSSFGFHEWSLEAMDEFEGLIKKMIAEGLTIATEQYECSAYFPIEWSENDGDDNADPTTVYVELPLDDGSDDLDDSRPRWSFTLTELVHELIEVHEHGGGGHIDEESAPRLKAVAASLRKLADVLDAALQRPAD